MAPQLARLAAAGVIVLLLGLAALSSHHPHRPAMLSSERNVMNIEASTFQEPSAMYTKDLTSSTPSSGQDFGQVLRNIKVQQAAAEAQMKHLVALNRAKASALRSALDGDSFHTGVAPAAVSVAAPKPKNAPKKIKLHPRSGRALSSRAKGKLSAVAGTLAASVAVSVGESQLDPKRVQARISRLLADSKARLHQDEQITITDLTAKAEEGGPWFQEQQTVRLEGDRRRVLGDQRLIKLLASMEGHQRLNAMQHLDAIDLEAKDDLNAAEVQARLYGVADEVNGHNHPLLAAGVHAGHSREFGMGGMEDEDEDHGSQILQAAGIRTDALPGFGTKVSIPFSFLWFCLKCYSRVHCGGGFARGRRAPSLENTPPLSNYSPPYFCFCMCAMWEFWAKGPCLPIFAQKGMDNRCPVPSFL